MEFNKLVFAGLTAGCLAAAAGGSYLAVRQSHGPHPFCRAVSRRRREYRTAAALNRGDRKQGNGGDPGTAAGCAH